MEEKIEEKKTGKMKKEEACWGRKGTCSLEEGTKKKGLA